MASVAAVELSGRDVPRGTFSVWKPRQKLRSSPVFPVKNNSLLPAHEFGIANDRVSNYAALKSLVTPNN